MYALVVALFLTPILMLFLVGTCHIVGEYIANIAALMFVGGCWYVMFRLVLTMVPK